MNDLWFFWHCNLRLLLLSDISCGSLGQSIELGRVWRENILQIVIAEWLQGKFYLLVLNSMVVGLNSAYERLNPDVNSPDKMDIKPQTLAFESVSVL